MMTKSRVLSGQPADTIRFEVRPVTDDRIGGHEVLICINDVVVTHRIAGVMGMDPLRLLVPRARLDALLYGPEAFVARCCCGDEFCTASEVAVIREGGLVRWEWLEEPQIDHGLTFAAADYDAEVARIVSDHSWARSDSA